MQEIKIVSARNVEISFQKMICPSGYSEIKCIMSEKNLFQFYTFAKREVIKAGYQQEIDVVEERRFEEQTADDFFFEYVWVVLNSGMKNKVALKIYENAKKIGMDAIKHKGKRDAIEQANVCRYIWFKKLQEMKSIDEQLIFLEMLPWIGPITKYHLARNLGIDVAKPDRHLQRIADHFKYFDVQKMCNTLSLQTNERIGTIDLVLWRFATINPPWKAEGGKIPGW